MKSRFSEKLHMPSRILSEGPDICLSYFNRKAVIALATRLTAELMATGGYQLHEIESAKDAVYFALIVVQGSLKTSGTAYLLSTLLESIGVSPDHAYWAGFAAATAVSLAMDLSPWGVLHTAMSTFAGVAGKKLSFWTYDDCKTAIVSVTSREFSK